MLITWWARYKEQCSIYIHNKWGREAKVYTDEGICHLWTLVSSQNHRLYIFPFFKFGIQSYPWCMYITCNYQLNLFTRNIEQLLSMSFELPHYPNGLWCIFELVHILKMYGWGISLLWHFEGHSRVIHTSKLSNPYYSIPYKC